MHSVRAICLRAFPELLAEIKMAGMIHVDRSIDAGSGVAAITLTVSNVMHSLVRVLINASRLLLDSRLLEKASCCA